MNAPERICDSGLLAGLETPEFLKRAEAEALYAWWSSRRLLIIKDGATVSLCADDLRGLLRFLKASHVEEQL